MSKKTRTLVLVVIGTLLIGSLASARAALPDTAIRAAASQVEDAGRAVAPAPAPVAPATPAMTVPAPAPSGQSAATGLPDAALVKLDADLLYDLARKKIESDGLAAHDNDPPAVAIIVPTVLFGSLVLVVWIVVIFRLRKTRQVHETLRLMVEKGADIPTELIAPARQRNVDLRRGLLMVFGGIGYMLFMGLLAAFVPDAINGLGVGLIPLFIGIGYLLVWRIEKRQADEA